MGQKVREFMTSAPVALQCGQTVAEAAEAVREHGIGDVPVADDGQLKGLVTDRDIVVRVAAEGYDPVAGICGPGLTTVAPGDEADAAVQWMRERAVRRVPVMEGRAVGVLSIGDMAIERDQRSALADISAQPPRK